MNSDSEWVNQIHHGDCLTVMQDMPRKLVELIVTSPPYNLLLSTGNGMRPGGSGKWANAKLAEGYPEHDDRMKYPDYVKWQRECLEAMMNLLPPHGAIYYVNKWRVQGGQLEDRREITEGFPVRQIIIWERSGGFNHNPHYHLPTYEVIHLIANSRFRLNKTGRSNPDVWRIDQDRDNQHPAPFPVELARRAIESSDARVILDPFCGSGSTPVAAMTEGRDWIGIEKSHEYRQMAKTRIRHHGQWAPENQLPLNLQE